MRLTALLLAISLVSPAVATAYCELSCLQALPKTASCHEQESQGGPAVSAGASLCHEEGSEGPAAVIVSNAPIAAPPAIVPAVAALAPPQPFTVHIAGSSLARPPDLLLLTTQLRI